MFLHYLKTAFRNITRFKIQSVIVILSIALGMVFCTLTLMWIRYERSYDSFYRNADDIYLIMQKREYSQGDEYSHFVEYTEGSYLSDKYPEIEAFTRCTYGSSYGVLNDGKYVTTLVGLTVDENFQSFFDVKVLEGDNNLNLTKNEIALTRTQADKLFEGRNPVGDTLNLNNDIYYIRSVIEDPGKPTSLPYEFLRGYDAESLTQERIVNTRLFVRVNRDNIKQLADEIQCDTFKYERSYTTYAGGSEIQRTQTERVIKYNKLMPISKIREEGIFQNGLSSDSLITGQGLNINLHYVYILMLLGIVLIICSLTNYFTLFVTKLRMRVREISLRYANGASMVHIVMLFCTEIAMILLLSLLVGAVICTFTIPYYKELSVMDKTAINIVLSYFLWAMIIGLASVLIALVFIALTGRRQLSQNFSDTAGKSGTALGYKLSIGFQLAVSICSIFCSVIINRQINHLLLSSDMGYRKHNAGYLYQPDIPETEAMVVKDRLMMMPELDKVVFGFYPPSHFKYSSMFTVYQEHNSIETAIFSANKEYLDLIEVEPVSGELFIEQEPDDLILINETLANLLGGPEQSIGQKVYYIGRDLTVKGVVRDLCYFDPKKEAVPLILIRKESNKTEYVKPDYFTFTYKDGVKWNALEEKILDILREIRPTCSYYIADMETDFLDFIKSENMLCKLLRIITLICVVISISGLYSIVSLLCQKRRKEIAIRKINGARTTDILKMFLKEYVPIIILSAIAAFSIGTMVMHRWLSTYVRQTPVTIWVYLSVFICMLLVIGLTVFGNIRRTMTENPADVIKSE